MSKAQIVSGDFTISIAIFIIILVLVLPLWSYVESHIKGSEERNDIESSLMLVSDVLVKTSGMPENWNQSNVRSLGLADKEGMLNLTKVLNFIKMDYNQTRSLLGIDIYELYISIKDIDGSKLTSGLCNPVTAYYSDNNEEMKTILANSGLVWDYYYGGSGTPERYDSRNFYSASKAEAFNAMLSNSSLYKTIIIENPELQESDIDINGLKNFLNLGGFLILEGNATLLKDSFGMNAELGPNREGIVTQKDTFVLTDIGENVTFGDAGWAFYDGSALNKLIIDKNDNNDALVGYWAYGLGRIYYISDINATVDGYPLELNIVGQKLAFGMPSGGHIVTNAQRLVLLKKERNVLAKMNVILWK